MSRTRREQHRIFGRVRRLEKTWGVKFSRLEREEWALILATVERWVGVPHRVWWRGRSWTRTDMESVRKNG